MQQTQVLKGLYHSFVCTLAVPCKVPWRIGTTHLMIIALGLVKKGLKSTQII